MATKSDMDLILNVSGNIMGNTICPFGDAAAMPAAAFIKKYRDEFEQHIVDRGCTVRNVQGSIGSVSVSSNAPPSLRRSLSFMDPVKLIIDGQEVSTVKGKTVIQAAAEVGIAIPHYCYHPKLSIAGNCRMCLIEIEKMPKLQIACNTQVAEGMTVLTQSPKVLSVRKAVMEFLLINHPVDCPICDQAGECWLQDYYMKHDLQDSRFRSEKSMTASARFSVPTSFSTASAASSARAACAFLRKSLIPGELTVDNRSDHSTIALFPGAVLDNPLSANVVDICPVGALTDRDFRFKVRVWYLEKTPSICPGCSTGCNISVEAYQNRIARFKPRVNEAVNSHWLCDEGRYCFYDLTGGERLTTPMIRQEGGLVPTTWEIALRAVVSGLRSAGSLAGILSGRNTNEEAFLFAKLMKKLSPAAGSGSVLSRARADRSGKDPYEPGSFA